MNKENLRRQGNTLSLGKYQFVLNPFFLPNTQTKEWVINQINQRVPIAKTWQKKSFTIESAWLEGDYIVIQVDVRTNPIPIAVIIAGTGFVIGGFVLWKILVEVRKLFTIEDIGDIGKIVTPIVVIGGSIFLYRKFAGKK
jgi:hypothetical protein